MDTRTLHHVVTPAGAWPDADADSLNDLARLLGSDIAAMDPMARVPVATRRLAEGTPLVHEGTLLDSVYVVRSGSLKCLRTLEDGYEQVTALALPGDVLGFDGLHCGHHAVTCVALELSTVCAMSVAALKALRARCPTLDDAWQRALSRQLARTAATSDMVAAVASEVRLARFILWLSARAQELGWSPRRLRLTLCRRDLASLLGVAHETVSRSFTTMADAGLLKVDNREIEILDPLQLRARARATRRPVDSDAITVSGASRLAVARPAQAQARWSVIGRDVAAS